MTVSLIAAKASSFLLKEKNQKFKKEGMLPPAGHTPGSPPLSGGPLRFFDYGLFGFKTYEVLETS